MYVYIYIYIYTYMYIYIYTYKYIYTHTHAYMFVFKHCIAICLDANQRAWLGCLNVHPPPCTRGCPAIWTCAADWLPQYVPPPGFGWARLE